MENLELKAKEVLTCITEDMTQEEILSLAKIESFNEQIAFFTALLKVCRLKRTEIIHQKKHFSKLKDYASLENCKQKLERLKQQEKIFLNFKQGLCEQLLRPEKKSNSMELFKRTETSFYRMITSCMYPMGEELEKIHESYQIELDAYSKKELFEKMKDSYLQECEKLSQEEKEWIALCSKKICEVEKRDFSLLEKEKIKLYFDHPSLQEEMVQYQNIKKSKKQLKIILEHIQKLLELQNHQIQKIEKKWQKEEDTPDIPSYDVCFQEKETLKKVLFYFESLKEEKFMNLIEEPASFDKYLTSLKSFIYSLPDSEKKSFCSIYLDLLKPKMKNFSKDKKSRERMIFIELRSSIRGIMKSIIIPHKKQRDYYYEILLPFLESNYNYTYIKAFLREIPSFQDARGEEGHILLEITDKYILNSKLKYVDQGFEYIDPVYFYQVFQLFFEAENPLSEREIIQIEEMLNEFYDYIVSKKYKEMDSILKQIETLQKCLVTQKKEVQFVFPDLKKEIHEMMTFKREDALSGNRVNLTSNYLEKIRNFILQNPVSEELSESEKIEVLGLTTVDYKNSLFPTPIFTLGKNTAYSMRYDDQGNTLFQIHTLDLASLIEEDCSLERNLKLMLGHDKELELPNFKKDELYPTITFQLKLTGKNEVQSFKYFKSMIQIDEIYSEKDFESYKENETLKRFLSCCRKLSIWQGEEEFFYSKKSVEKIIQKALSEEIIHFLTTSELPFIYINEVLDTEQIQLQNHYSVCELLSKLTKAESSQINRILKQPLGVIYSDVPTTSSKVMINHDYLTLLLERWLTRLQIGESFPKEELEKLRFEMKDEVQTLNQSKGYVPLHMLYDEKYFQKRIDK